MIEEKGWYVGTLYVDTVTETNVLLTINNTDKINIFLTCYNKCHLARVTTHIKYTMICIHTPQTYIKN